MSYNTRTEIVLVTRLHVTVVVTFSDGQRTCDSNELNRIAEWNMRGIECVRVCMSAYTKRQQV